MNPSDIYDSLPTHCRELVHEIETTCGFEVEVRNQDEYMRAVGGPFFGAAIPGVPGAVSDIDKAVVLYPGALNTLSDDDYHHELMHIHRKLVQLQPEFISTYNARHRENAARLDNEIEHLAIHGEQYRVSLTFRTVFSRAQRKFWKSYPPTHGVQGAIDVYSAKLAALLRYFKVREFGPAPMVQYARERLKRAGHLYEIHDRYKQLKDVWPDKRLTAQVCLDVLDDPHDRFHLMLLDVANQTRQMIPIAT